MRKRTLDFIRTAFFSLLGEKRILQLVGGKEYGGFLTKLVPNHDQFNSKTIRSVNRFGINFSLDISDLVDWFIFFGFVDPAREKLLKHVSPGDVVLDIGANVGEVTYRSSRIVGDNGQVHAFEPNFKNFERLQENFKLNHFENITFNQVALGLEKGSVSLECNDDHNLGTTRVASSKSEGNLVPMTTVDDYVNDTNLSRIDFMKVDVEGYEFFVLAGAIHSIKKFKPILFFELDDTNLKTYNSSARELVKKMEELSYQISDARDERPLNSEWNFEGCHLDVIARQV
ncbi:FkbM family methyltransferase [Ekhidna sp.]